MNFKYADTIDLLQSFFSNSEKKEVLQKFCAELHYPGFNVRADCKKYGVTPHYFDSAMSNFYLKTNSFIFELSVENCEDYIERLHRRVHREVNQLSRPFAKAASKINESWSGSQRSCLPLSFAL